MSANVYDLGIDSKHLTQLNISFKKIERFKLSLNLSFKYGDDVYDWLFIKQSVCFSAI